MESYSILLGLAFSLSVILWRFIQLLVCVCFLSNSPCIYHSLLKHSPIDGQSGFQFFAVTNNTAMNVCVQVFVLFFLITLHW